MIEGLDNQARLQLWRREYPRSVSILHPAAHASIFGTPPNFHEVGSRLQFSG